MTTTRRVLLTNFVFGAALMLGHTTADAESPAPSAERKPDVAEPARARLFVPPPPPVVARKVDPLEAALAQAMATTERPAQPKKNAVPARRARKAAVVELARETRLARSVSLGKRSRARGVPETEEVVRFDVQPLEPRVVRAMMAEKAAQLHYCHERMAGLKGAPTGAVTLKFVIEPKGNVSSVEVFAGQGRGRELERCLAQRIRSWKFPAADAPTVVDYPLVFDIAGSTLTD